jgi:light-regulated signal transduction histidine kinase (bacteriophytochrome)
MDTEQREREARPAVLLVEDDVVLSKLMGTLVDGAGYRSVTIADHDNRLFTPYFRTRRTRDIPGSGLGLHVSRRFAEQHAGRLWLDRSNDAGSTFVLALPLAG